MEDKELTRKKRCLRQSPWSNSLPRYKQCFPLSLKLNNNNVTTQKIVVINEASAASVCLTSRKILHKGNYEENNEAYK